MITTIATIATTVDNKSVICTLLSIICNLYSVICNLYSVIYHLRRVEDELEPPARVEDDVRVEDELLLTVDVGRRVDVEVEVVVFTDVGRETDAADDISRVVVGRAGNTDVVVLRLCVLADVDEVVLFVEVDAPRTFDVETLLSLARRTDDGVDVVATRFEAATFAAKREELFMLRRSFSFPLL